jgi:hypothetical protein
MTLRRVGVIWPKQASSRCRELDPGTPEKATNNRAEACRDVLTCTASTAGEERR